MACAELPDSDNQMFGPLNFEDSTSENALGENSEVVCLLCENTFNLPLGLVIFIKHLFEVHNVVIEDIQNISDLAKYIEYWRGKFKECPIEEIIPAIDSTDQLYFVFSTLLKEDKELRHKLQLERVLKVQEFERTDGGYQRGCLLCKVNFEGTRHDYIRHLAEQHNLQLGNPQNLVYIEQLVEKIHGKFVKLQCLFCGRTFPQFSILKEHMRKKLHKRINRHNTDFDKFYIVNYLEPNKTWKAIQRQDDNLAEISGGDVDQNADEEYFDWAEKADLITCLLCEKRETDINTLCLHMEADHDFDFVELTQSFDYYQKIKLVNYIRKKIHDNRCIYCNEAFVGRGALQVHLYEARHCKLPEIIVFDQPEFYFPTYENDAFLYLIDDVED